MTKLIFMLPATLLLNAPPAAMTTPELSSVVTGIIEQLPQVVHSGLATNYVGSTRMNLKMSVEENEVGSLQRIGPEHLHSSSFCVHFASEVMGALPAPHQHLWLMANPRMRAKFPDERERPTLAHKVSPSWSAF